MIAVKEEGEKVIESAFNYAEIKLRLLTLKTADKTSRLATGFLTVLILILIFIFSVVLLSIGIAILLSNALDSASAGFFIMGGFYVVAGAILVAMRKQIIFEPLLNSIVNALAGAELKAENKLENVQDKIEDKLNLESNSTNYRRGF